MTIFALIESPSDKHQRHARRYSTNVSRTHTAIRQKSAAYTPLFNKCQRHTHRYLTNVSGIYTAIRQNSAAYSPLFDKCQRYTHRYSTNVSGTRTATATNTTTTITTIFFCFVAYYMQQQGQSLHTERQCSTRECYASIPVRRETASARRTLCIAIPSALM